MNPSRDHRIDHNFSRVPGADERANAKLGTLQGTRKVPVGSNLTILMEICCFTCYYYYYGHYLPFAFAFQLRGSLRRSDNIGKFLRPPT